MPISFWLNDVDDEEVASEHLNLLKWSLNSEMSGFALGGKLLERMVKGVLVHRRGNHV